MDIFPFFVLFRLAPFPEIAAAHRIPAKRFLRICRQVIPEMLVWGRIGAEKFRDGCHSLSKTARRRQAEPSEKHEREHDRNASEGGDGSEAADGQEPALEE